MSKDKITKYKPSEVYEKAKNLIVANEEIIKKGGTPISLCISGVHGIGKSTLCKELAEDLGKSFFKLNLAQLTEPSELLGFYSKEHKMVKEVEEGGVITNTIEAWVPENLILTYIKDGFKYSTDENRIKTVACPPEWVVNLKEDSILCLDDFTRSNALFAQAVMELINTGTMIGWDLSKKRVQIILNENPDDGTYNTTNLDDAQVDRMFKVHMEWDAKDWAARAEKIGVDERLINFVLSIPEYFEDKKKEGISASGQVTPRMMDKFFNVISTIDDFHKNWDQVIAFGAMSVGDSLVAQLQNFVNKRLDKLPSIEQMIKVDTIEEAKKKLTMACGDAHKDPQNWRGATASILSIRLYNYAKHNSDNLTKAQIRQYGDLIRHSSFTIDLTYMMVRQVVNCGNNFAKELSAHPEFIKLMQGKTI